MNADVRSSHLTPRLVFLRLPLSFKYLMLVLVLISQVCTRLLSSAVATWDRSYFMRKRAVKF